MRYRIRTLLALTTMVAVVLGVAAAMYRTDVAAYKKMIREDSIPIERRNPSP
jgi:hypothetical protein